MADDSPHRVATPSSPAPHGPGARFRQDSVDWRADRLMGTPARLEAFGAIASAPVARMVRRAHQLGSSEVNVMIAGEPGTGRQLLGRWIHALSPRSGRPIFRLDCRAYSASRLRATLLGPQRRLDGSAGPGLLELAQGATLYLEGIEALRADVQALLRRVLVEADEPRPDVRLLSAVVRPPRRGAEADFDEVLLDHLDLVQLALPPLRQDPGAIPSIASCYLDRLAAWTGRGPWELTDRSAQRLREAPWHGNLMALFDCLDGATSLVERGPLDVCLEPVLRPAQADRSADRPRGSTRRSEGPGSGADLLVSGWPTLRELERAYVERVLERTRGKIYGPGGAAELLGLKPSTLQSRMIKLGVTRPKRRRSGRRRRR